MHKVNEVNDEMFNDKMFGVLAGLRVLDLSWGRAGPMTTMMLADHGAEVTRIEAPEGAPCGEAVGQKVWHRGKRSAILDLKDAADKEVFIALATHADILVESFSPGVTKRLGIDFDTLQALNPRLIYCSITAYGRNNSHAERPGYDPLVAARCGLQWEQRGWPEGALNRMARRPDPFADFDMPSDSVQGAPRPGPLFVASQWPSMGAFFSASLGISAALVERERSGRGQWVETSLLQGALVSASGVWQRAERPDEPGFDTWIIGSKAPKGHFQCSDGRWVHNWVMNPRFILTATADDSLNASPDLSVQNDPSRFSTAPEELFAIAHYQPLLAERMARFTAREWTEAAAVAGVTMQEIRTPEEAFSDPLLLADGCVAKVDDPEWGSVSQVGIAYRLDTSPGVISGPAPSFGEHTVAVKMEAAALHGRHVAQAPASVSSTGGGPLAGVRVLDLGLAVAGPFGTQLLSDLGAEVIKINALHDTYWHANHIAYACNRGKRSIALNLKDPRAMEILHKLVSNADVVQHNMRYDAAERLGVDYASLKKLNPRLIYCHTRGFERKGPRALLPGNEQTGIALAGVQYEDGGMARGGKPMWTLTSFGDMGNGFLSAVAIAQALYHRARTGVGQMCDTSIINACLLNTSYAVAFPDGRGVERPRIDAMQFGFNALCRLYETAEGWLCLVAPEEKHWQALCAALPALTGDVRFSTAAGRAEHDDELAAALATSFSARSGADWFAALDAVGVPSEISSPNFSLGLHDDPELKRRGWVASFQHPLVGRLDQVGLCVDFSATPGRVQHRPFVVGEHSIEILRELGYSDQAIAQARAEGYIGVWDGGAAPERVRRTNR